jgi:hypothetical protein
LVPWDDIACKVRTRRFVWSFNIFVAMATRLRL